MLRSQQPRGWNTAYNQPEKGEWQFNDIKEMSQWSKCQEVLIDEIFREFFSLLSFTLCKLNWNV